MILSVFDGRSKPAFAFIFFSKGGRLVGKYIAKRILSGVITIVILITACFFLMHAIPGSPFAKGEQGVPEAVMQRLNEKYGLDQPLYKQYFTYLDQILHGDFGISYKNSSVQVNDLIERGFPISARIGILAVLLSLVVGVLLGVTSAVKRGSLFDGISMVIATIGVCVPLFVISVLLLYLFAGVLKVPGVDAGAEVDGLPAPHQRPLIVDDAPGAPVASGNVLLRRVSFLYCRS